MDFFFLNSAAQYSKMSRTVSPTPYNNDIVIIIDILLECYSDFIDILGKGNLSILTWHVHRQ